MKLLLWIWILGLIVACTHPSERPPEVPDPQSSLTMVQKLETLLADKGLAAGERRLLTRRLADIYSDGARNFDGLEPTTSGQNCEPCKEAVAYRLKAVELYRQLLAGSGVAERSHLTEQILHLYEVTDLTAQAQRGYAEVIQTPSLYSSDLVRVAALGIADFQFNKSNYVRAERFYEQALNLDQKGLRIPYFYSRIAWCKFHQGRADLASQRM